MKDLVKNIIGKILIADFNGNHYESKIKSVSYLGYAFWEVSINEIVPIVFEAEELKTLIKNGTLSCECGDYKIK